MRMSSTAFITPWHRTQKLILGRVCSVQGCLIMSRHLTKLSYLRLLHLLPPAWRAPALGWLETRQEQGMESGQEGCAGKAQQNPWSKQRDLQIFWHRNTAAEREVSNKPNVFMALHGYRWGEKVWDKKRRYWRISECDFFLLFQCEIGWICMKIMVSIIVKVISVSKDPNF